MHRSFTLIIFCLIPFLLFHSREKQNMEDAVKKSSVIGTGIIESVSRNGTRCNTTTIAKIKVLEIFKGSLEGKPLHLAITEHHWKKSFWPWQEDCPSVHYMVPPFEIKIEKGVKFVFAADHFKGEKECYVTAAAAYERLDELKRYAGLQ